MKLIQIFKEHKMVVKIVGVVTGGLVGYLYYRLVGCRSGACPLTGNPYLSILWGAIMGLLIAWK